MGIEVELERVVVVQNPQGWHQIKDGSLKVKGKEFTIPVWHTHALPYLTDLFSSLDRPEANSRCSVHVHCNILDFTLEDLKSLILLYIIFERPLYRFSGKRWNNVYCVPVQTWAIGTNLKHFLTFNDFSAHFPKYSGLNILPDNGKLGTVEFRQMAGSRNPRYINTWINIVAKLVQSAKKYNYLELIDRIKTMRMTSEYWDLFNEVFGEYTHALNYSTFDKDVEKGITFAKLISTE